MSQTESFHELVNSTGCGVLLDITNFYINSVNHGFDAVTFLEQLPLDRVVQVHLAGGFWAGGLLIDGHSEPVEEESWRLLGVLASKTEVRSAIIEHDSNFLDIRLLVQEVSRARQAINRT